MAFQAFIAAYSTQQCFIGKEKPQIELLGEPLGPHIVGVASTTARSIPGHGKKPSP